MLDISIIILLFLGGFGFVRLVMRQGLTYWDKRNLYLLWIFHLIFSVLFYIYSLNNPSDANGYWRLAKNATWEEFNLFLSQGPGTFFIYVLNYFPANILDLDIFTGTIFYSLLSFIGFALFYKIAKTLIPNNTVLFKIPLFPYLFFLPSFHFWTVGVGKDSLILFSLGVFCYSLVYVRKYALILIISLGLIYMVRPHILILLLVSFAFGYLTSSKLTGYKKILSFAVLISLLIIVLPRVFSYANIDGYDLDSVFTRFDKQAESLSRPNVGSSIDISSYSYPMKFFTFLYRPLFFDARNALYLVVSVENLILLGLTFKLLFWKPIRVFRKSPLIFKGFLMFIVFGTLLFSSILSNLGIILRMKTMFLPGFVLFLMWAFSYKQEVESVNVESLPKNQN